MSTENKKIKFKWEELNDKSMPHFYTVRAKVFGGWLVRTSEWSNADTGIVQSEALTFVPDPEHEWEVE